MAVGLDYSPTMTSVSFARNRRLIADGRGGVVQANVAALPFASRAFDKAFSVESLYFWPNPSESLREVRRVLKPGGRVALAMDISLEGRDTAAIADTAERLNMAVFSRADLERLLGDGGFNVVDVDAAPERGKGWICAIGEKPAS
jgi:SAM-dependent methyltransferase